MSHIIWKALLDNFKTQHGLPPDIFLGELQKKVCLTKNDKICILNIYLSEFVEHKLKSGVEFNGKNHKKLQEINEKILINFIEKNEIEID